MAVHHFENYFEVNVKKSDNNDNNDGRKRISKYFRVKKPSKFYHVHPEVILGHFYDVYSEINPGHFYDVHSEVIPGQFYDVHSEVFSWSS